MIAFLNGRMIPASELTIPAYDAGFVLGATVSEQLRTFGGRLFELDAHLARLQRGLEITQIDAGCSTAQLAAWAEELVAANHQLLAPGDDLGLSIFVTPGPYATLAPPDVPRQPTIGMHTYPLPFHLWADKYETGEHLVVSTVCQVSPGSWPRELKCRSRMHYYLAEKEVRRRAPDARPLLMDKYGMINETPTANVVGLITKEVMGTESDVLAFPQRDAALPGISLATIERLAVEKLRLMSVDGWSTPADLSRWNEVWLTSTPFCLLPVTKLDDAPIGNGRPGPVFEKILRAWSDEVGIDIAAQARKFATRTA